MSAAISVLGHEQVSSTHSSSEQVAAGRKLAVSMETSMLRSLDVHAWDLSFSKHHHEGSRSCMARTHQATAGDPEWCVQRQQMLLTRALQGPNVDTWKEEGHLPINPQPVSSISDRQARVIIRWAAGDRTSSHIHHATIESCQNCNCHILDACTLAQCASSAAVVPNSCPDTALPTLSPSTAADTMPPA